MSTLVQRINDLAIAIRDKFNNLIPFGRLSSASRANKSFLAIVQASGDFDLLQDSLWQKHMAIYLPSGLNTSSTVLGMATNSSGSTVARVPTATNLMQAARRNGHVSNATTGSIAFIRDTWPRLSVGQGGGIRGFFCSIKFGVSDAAPVAAASMFVGLYENVNPWGAFAPLNQSNSIGVGCAAGDPYLSVVAKGGSGVAHVINLGENFPANTSNTDWYHAIFYSPSSEPNKIYYRISREGTAYVATGELIPAVYPSPTATLGPVACRMNNTTALAVGIDVGHMYSQVDH